MAKKNLNRRSFMKLAGAGAAGALLQPRGFVSPSPAHADTLNVDPVVVTVNLRGGASMNMVCPYVSAWYQKNPDTHFKPHESLPATPDQGFHPQLAGLKALWDQKYLAIGNQFGFQSGHSRSHELSSKRWMTCDTDPYGKPGLLNTLACQLPDAILPTLSLSGGSTAVKGLCPGVQRFNSLAQLAGTKFRNFAENEAIENARREIFGLSSPLDNPLFNSMRQSINELDNLLPTFQMVESTALPIVNSPYIGTNLASDFRDAAKVIANAETTGTRCIYISHGSYDTHANAVSRLDALLNDLNGSIAYFVDVMKAMGLFNKVVVMIVTEFTRGFQNGAAGAPMVGDDHGGGGPTILIGGNVDGGKQLSPVYTEQQILNNEIYVPDRLVDIRNYFEQVFSPLGFDLSPITGGQNFDRTDLSLYKA